MSIAFNTKIKAVLILAALVATLNGCTSQTNTLVATLETSELDKQTIAQLQKDIPLILAEQGWEPYEALFGKDYQNWQMTRDAVLSREEFLAGVNTWYEAGNRAVGSETETVGFIPLAPDMVMYLHKQVETFDLTDNETTVSRDIRFVSIFKKENDEWKIHFTAFMDAPTNE